MQDAELMSEFDHLLLKDERAAHQAMLRLVERSQESDEVYGLMDELGGLLDDKSSYVRTRALTLIAHNARWDTKGKVDALLDRFLSHITDVKPITARQCVKLLPVLARSKPQLIPRIERALRGAELSQYADSMRPLIERDIADALKSMAQDAEA